MYWGEEHNHLPTKLKTDINQFIFVWLFVLVEIRIEKQENESSWVEWMNEKMDGWIDGYSNDCYQETI